MLRVKVKDLAENMVLAEPIVDFTGKVLLNANTKLSAKHIEILQTWEIDFIRIREAHDTDESIKEALKKDREKEEQEKLKQKAIQNEVIKKKLGITVDNILKVLSKEDADNSLKDEQIKVGTLVNHQSLKYYADFIKFVTKLFETNARVKDMAIAELNEVSQKMAQYISNTPGVIGYAMMPADASYNELARHTVGTTIVAGKIAILLNYGERDIKNVILGSLLHDIGKIKLSEDNHWLRAAQKDLYQSHVTLGVSLIKDKTWIPKEVLLAIAQHHEKIDGKGFPMGFKGNKIHPYAKIVALADYFDHITHTKDADNAPNLVQIINGLPLWHLSFDIVICEILREYLRDFLLSNNVKLGDGRLAEVIYMHQNFSEPVIKTNDGQFIDLNKTKNYKIERYTI